MRIAATTVFIVAVGLGPVFAKGGPPSRPAGARAPKVTRAAGATAPKRSTTHGAPTLASTHVTSPHGKAPATTAKGAHAGGHKSATTTQVAGRGKSAGARASASTATSATTTRSKGGRTSTTASTTTGTTSTTTVATGPNVPKNPKLQARLLAMLPAGTTIDDAAAGFKNQGQFIAAVHVSNNLGLPFSQLKMQMVDEGLSLGQAIQAVKPTVDATTAARVGEQQATADLR